MSATRPAGHERVLALAARACQGTALAAALVLLTRFYALETQALFFVFLSLAALVQLGDFGLAQAALPTASQLAAESPPQRLAAFGARARRLNVGMALASVMLVGVLGAALFRARADSQAWLGPWLCCLAALVLAQVANLEIVLTDGALSALRAWQLRLRQELAGGVVLVLALALGAGLWSLAVYWFARAAVVLPDRCRLTPQATAPSDSAGPDWQQEIWPFQWRIGLSTLSGFLIFQAFTPVLLAAQGSQAAGRFGLSLAIMNMLLLVSTAWPLSQAARYSQLLATCQPTVLRATFLRTLTGSTVLAAAMAVAVLLALMALTLAGVPQVERLADLPTTATLLAAGLLHHTVMVLAVLMRAERREPLLWASVGGGLTTLLAMWLAALHGTLLAPALAHAGLAALGLALATMYYRAFALRVFARSAAGREAA